MVMSKRKLIHALVRRLVHWFSTRNTIDQSDRAPCVEHQTRRDRDGRDRSRSKDKKDKKVRNPQSNINYNNP